MTLQKFYRFKHENDNGSFIYIYKDSFGKIISDPFLLTYFKKLVIPPAYTNVEINYLMGDALPKILYKGVDSKGRMQVIYSSSWNEKANFIKYKNLLQFSLNYNTIIKKIKELMITKNSKNKNVSVILDLILHCNFRIGNTNYEKLYGSHGLLTLKKKHITLKDNSVISIKFIGKKGVINACEKRVNSGVYSFIKNKFDKIGNEDYIFTVNSPKIVNRLLKKIHPLLTSKMFRTYSGNILLIKYLKNLDNSSEKLRKKNLINGLKYVASEINNTPAVAKKNYINNSLINIYLNDIHTFNKLFKNTKRINVQFAEFLNSVIYNS